MWRVLPDGESNGGAGCDFAPAWQPGGAGTLHRLRGGPQATRIIMKEEDYESGRGA